MKEEEGKVDEAASLIQEVQAGPLQLWRVHKAFLGFMLGGAPFPSAFYPQCPATNMSPTRKARGQLKEPFSCLTFSSFGSTTLHNCT